MKRNTSGFVCETCGKNEPDGFLINGKLRVYKPTRPFICSKCVQKSLSKNVNKEE